MKCLCQSERERYSELNENHSPMGISGGRDIRGSSHHLQLYMHTFLLSSWVITLGMGMGMGMKDRWSFKIEIKPSVSYCGLHVGYIIYEKNKQGI